MQENPFFILTDTEPAPRSRPDAGSRTARATPPAPSQTGQTDEPAAPAPPPPPAAAARVPARVPVRVPAPAASAATELRTWPRGAATSSALSTKSTRRQLLMKRVTHKLNLGSEKITPVVKPFGFSANALRCLFFGRCFYCRHLGHSQKFCSIRRCSGCQKYGHTVQVCHQHQNVGAGRGFGAFAHHRETAARERTVRPHGRPEGDPRARETH